MICRSIFFILAFILFGRQNVWCSVSDSEKKLIGNLQNEKQKYNAVELHSREVMGELYDINLRMKKLSKKRDALNNRMMVTEGNIENLSRFIVFLESKIKSKKNLLSRRLRALYMLGDEGLPISLFTSTNIYEIDKSLKYLKIISTKDFKTIKSYENDLIELNLKHKNLNREVAKLIKVKKSLKRNEISLTTDQDLKSKILKNLGQNRKRTLDRITNLRSSASGAEIDSMIDLSFYERKGQMPAPVNGVLERDYGIIENKTFGYRLAHKGFTYKVNFGSEIKSIFQGKISFIGEIIGYGKTIIIDHGDHYYTVYANADRENVKEGQVIEESQVIARSTNKLYFEIRHFSESIDPASWLN